MTGVPLDAPVAGFSRRHLRSHRDPAEFRQLISPHYSPASLFKLGSYPAHSFYRRCDDKRFARQCGTDGAAGQVDVLTSSKGVIGSRPLSNRSPQIWHTFCPYHLGNLALQCPRDQPNGRSYEVPTHDVGSDVCIFGSPRIHTDTHTASVGISRSFEALAIITTQTVISRFLISDIVPGSLPALTA